MVSPTQLCWRYHSLPLRQRVVNWVHNYWDVLLIMIMFPLISACVRSKFTVSVAPHRHRGDPECEPRGERRVPPPASATTHADDGPRPRTHVSTNWLSVFYTNCYRGILSWFICIDLSLKADIVIVLSSFLVSVHVSVTVPMLQLQCVNVNNL